MSDQIEDAAEWLCELLPACKKREVLLDLVRTGQKFKAQQSGRKPGALAAIVLECVRRSNKPYTFEKLLTELRIEAMRRDLGGDSIVEKVDREFEILTVHLPSSGRVQRSFSSLWPHFRNAKKKLE